MNKSDFKGDFEFPEEDIDGRVLVAVEEQTEQVIDENGRVIDVLYKRIPVYKEKQYVKTFSPLIIKETFQK
jgi:hypothetical protein